MLIGPATIAFQRIVYAVAIQARVYAYFVNSGSYDRSLMVQELQGNDVDNLNLCR